MTISDVLKLPCFVLERPLSPFRHPIAPRPNSTRSAPLRPAQPSPYPRYTAVCLTSRLMRLCGFGTATGLRLQYRSRKPESKACTALSPYCQLAALCSPNPEKKRHTVLFFFLSVRSSRVKKCVSPKIVPVLGGRHMEMRAPRTAFSLYPLGRAQLIPRSDPTSQILKTSPIRFWQLQPPAFLAMRNVVTRPCTKG